MVFPTYKDYTDSGSRWLGNIPKHWSARKLKFLALVQPSNVDKKTVENEEPVLLCNYTDVYKNEYIDSSLIFMEATATKEEIRKFSVEVGDVIVTKDSEDRNDIAVPACASEKVRGLVCGYHLTQIKPKYLDGRFLLRLFQSKGFNAQFIVAANGVTRFGLPQYAIANAVSPVPPIEEQKAIARFLDHKTAQIDALIAKKQSLLDKLAEQRTALVSQAVTKGLDPSVATRDSGAAWLDKIPEHWSTSRVKFVAKVGNGSTPSRDNPDYWFDGDFPWLNSSVVNREVVDSADQFVTGVALKECHLPIIEPPAVLVGITGQGKTRGMSSKLTFRATINQHLVYVKPYADSINVDYLHHIFERAYAYLRNESDAGGSTKGAITCSQIENLAIPLPPLAEQEQIVRFVDEDYSRISRLQKKVKAALQRLQEYRAALITNAVTGKIDVRDFCIPTTTEQREVAHG